jgi:ribose 5-phosphate isomerase B
VKIAVGSDHAAFEHKQYIIHELREEGHEVLDFGAKSAEPYDYPDAAREVAKAVSSGVADRGVLMCGTGLGMCMTANKIHGIRAALCHDELTAQISRRQNNANVLCIASDVLGEELIRRIVVSWLMTPFDGGGRHERRVRKIALIERGLSPLEYDEQNGLSEVDDSGLSLPPPGLAPPPGRAIGPTY